MRSMQLFQVLSEWLERSPGPVVSYGLGILTMALLLTGLHWLVRWPLLRRNNALIAEVRELSMTKASQEARLRAACDENVTIRAHQSEMITELTQLRDAKSRMEEGLLWLQGEKAALLKAQQVVEEENRTLRDAKLRLEIALQGLTAEKQELLRREPEPNGQADASRPSEPGKPGDWALRAK